MKRSSKPMDPNQLAAEVVRISVEEIILPDEGVKAYLSRIGRKGGLKGGPARAKKLSRKKRQAIGKKAAEARWSKGIEIS